MNFVHRLIWLGAIALTVSACNLAPAIAPTSIRLLSEPDGAVATTSKGTSCVTPCAIEVTTIDSFSVNFAKPGFASQSVTVASISSTSIADGFTPSFSIGPVQISGPDNYDRGRFRYQFIPNPVSVKLQPAQ